MAKLVVNNRDLALVQKTSFQLGAWWVKKNKSFCYILSKTFCFLSNNNFRKKIPAQINWDCSLMAEVQIVNSLLMFVKSFTVILCYN